MEMNEQRKQIMHTKRSQYLSASCMECQSFSRVREAAESETALPPAQTLRWHSDGIMAEEKNAKSGHYAKLTSYTWLVGTYSSLLNNIAQTDLLFATLYTLIM